MATKAKNSSRRRAGAGPKGAAHHKARALLDSFANPNPGRDYLVRIVIPEFTCLCPITGQPDFARFVLEFVPDRRNVELKSLKLYVASYRNEGAFHEAVTNRVLDDLVGLIAPRFLRLTAFWNVRGGIYTTVAVEHRQGGWKPPAVVDLGPLGAQGAHSPDPFEAPGA